MAGSSMPAPQDDLLGHQTSDAFSIAGGGDTRFVKRCAYTVHPIAGAPVLLDICLGIPPRSDRSAWLVAVVRTMAACR